MISDHTALLPPVVRGFGLVDQWIEISVEPAKDKVTAASCVLFCENVNSPEISYLI